MKRFFTALVTAAIISMPMAASSLEVMDNSQLKTATGQAGVSIAVDDIVIYQESMADVTYWDNDGVSSGAGTIGDITKAGVMIDYADNIKKLTTIDAITDASKYGVTKLRGIFGFEASTNIGIVDKVDLPVALAAGLDPTNGNMAGMTTGISPLTIDVGTCQSLTAGWAYNTLDAKGSPIPNPNYDPNDPNSPQIIADPDKPNGDVAGVVIGLPSVEITTYYTNEVRDIKVVVADASQAMNSEHNTLISIEKTGFTKMAILGGRLEIAPH